MEQELLENDYEIRLHYSIIPYYKDSNFFRWIIGCFITLVEQTEFNHVWLSIKNQEKYVCVDLSGYSSTPIKYEELMLYYGVLYTLAFKLNVNEYNAIISKIEELKNVKYSILKIFVLLINRKFGTKFLFDEYNSTSTEIIARILNHINLYKNTPQLCGLKELKTFYKENSL